MTESGRDPLDQAIDDAARKLVAGELSPGLAQAVVSAIEDRPRPRSQPRWHGPDLPSSRRIGAVWRAAAVIVLMASGAATFVFVGKRQAPATSQQAAPPVARASLLPEGRVDEVMSASDVDGRRRVAGAVKVKRVTVAPVTMAAVTVATFEVGRVEVGPVEVEPVDIITQRGEIR